jgi:hypothetical protein
MDPRLLAGLRALVDAQRLRMLARLAAGPTDAATIAAELHQPLSGIRRHLDTLRRAGLVEARPGEPGRFGARLDRVGELALALAALQAEADGRPIGAEGEWPHDGEPPAATVERLGLTAEERKVLRSYLVDGRLATIPAQGRKRQVILRFLVERVFTEDRTYPETEVNQRLALFHPDVASLRRYLVDGGLVQRAAGVYARRAWPVAPGAGDDG